MTDTTPTPAPTPPAVPAKVRTAAYYVLLALSALVLLATGLAPVWLDADTATRVVASGGVATSVLGLIAGGLGVAYRPTLTDA
jgi:hypothetical protein